MKQFSFLFQLKNSVKIILFFLFLFFLQSAAGYIWIREFSFFQTNKALHEFTSRVQSDLQYENGKWDTRLYAADPYTPNPTGSSGFLDPLYIVTRDGFVIERNQPIHNLLDSSDFKRLISFKTPQTIQGITNEKWRIVSVPFKNVVITVAYYNPQDEILEKIDAELQSSAETIRSSLALNNTLDPKNLDIRTIPYDVSFEVVDTFNKVLANNGRVPSFIDPSYVINLGQDNQKEQMVIDQITKEKILITITPLYTKAHDLNGIIVAGKSLTDIDALSYAFVYFSFIFGATLILPLTVLTIFMFRRELKNMFTKQNQISSKPIEKILFDKQKSKILIDEKEITIPYDSNQYLLCKLLFLHKEKRWENDEILEEFGEEISFHNQRKTYDAMIAVNKKLGIKFILYTNKTYQINPEFVSTVNLK